MKDILIVLGLSLAVILATMLGCLQATLSTISTHEVRRRALSRQKGARSLHVLHARGYETIVSFILLRVFLSVGIIFSLIELFPPILSIIASTLLLTLTTEIISRFYLRDVVLRNTDLLMPLLSKLLTLTSPISRPVGRLLDRQLGKLAPVIQSRQQLIEVLEAHKTSPYSDIESEQVEIVKHALQFGDKQIRKVMTLLKDVHMVSADSSVGPVLLDELHKSKHTRFPVWSGKRDNIIGVLYLRSLVNVRPNGKVKDFMEREVYFVHEQLPLGHALQAFIKTAHHIFVVLDSREDQVGIITLEDVIEQIIGAQIDDDFDAYDSPREVAVLYSKKEGLTTETKVVE